MSGSEPDFITQIAIEVAKVIAGSIAGFIVGLLTRKTVWRKLVKVKKWIFNDILSLDLLVVRQYPHMNVRSIDITVFDHIKSKFPEAQLVQKHPTGMIISMPPIFHNLEVLIEKIPLEEDSDYDGEKMIKLILRSENPVRLGIRELGKLKQFESYADGIFDTIHAFLFTEKKAMKQSYAVCDITRTIYFVQEKVFDLRDDEMGVRVRGKDNKLTIEVSSISKIRDAIQKYHFA